MASLLVIMAAAAAVQAKPAPAPPYLPLAATKAIGEAALPPPAPGTAAANADLEIYRRSTDAVGDRTWQQAKKFLAMARPAYRQPLSCAFGAQIDGKLTPQINRLLVRVESDANAAVFWVKNRHKRKRPSSPDGPGTCQPDGGAAAAQAGGFSYPSKHAAVGYLWGLVLADLQPARRADLIAFGSQTGDMWVACRVNWQSDVEQGRQIAMKLHRTLVANPAYQADFARAKAELATAPPPFSC